MKCQEQASPWRLKADQWLPEAGAGGRGWGNFQKATLPSSHKFSRNSPLQGALVYLLLQQANILQLSLDSTDEIIDSRPAGEVKTPHTLSR